MSAKPVKVQTNAAAFPFLYKHAQRTVLELQDMGPRMPGAFYGSQENAEFGQPQLIYCENVLPHAKGIFSISTGVQIAAISPASTAFDQAIPLRDVAENQYVFSPAGGLNYVLDPTTGIWTSTSPFAFTNTLVTRAYVNGRSFICYEKTKVIEFNPGTGLFTTLALTLPAGLAITDVRGIGSASNYLLLFTDITIYWCSPLNILDFATTDQGAGQQIPIDIKGQITSLLSCSGGFIAYTARNAVGATFTNNGNSPFVFKEIANCGGAPSWEQVTSDAESGAHYLWGTGGLQKVTLAKADSIAPDLTDFLTGNQTESWDAINKAVLTVGVGTSINTKLSYVADRYLCISYGQTGVNSFSACLMFDTVLERWGKVVRQHCDVFMYPYPTFAGSWFYSQLPGLYSDLGNQTYADLDTTRLTPLPAKRGIAFLSSSGQIDILNTDYAQAGSAGVAIFGRLQSQRQRALTLLNAELDTVKEGVTCTLLPSDSAGTERASPVAMAAAYANGVSRRFESYETALNFDLAVEGAFVLNNLMLRVRNHGYR